MTNKYNNFIAHRMREEQPDLEKLILLRSKIMRKYGIPVDREPILLFEKNYGKLVKVAEWITAQEYSDHDIHCPDIVFYVKGKRWILEIDGLIHNVKSSVVKKDKRRNESYGIAKLNFIIINEFEIIERLNLEEKPLSAEQIFTEFERIVEEKRIF